MSEPGNYNCSCSGFRVRHDEIVSYLIGLCNDFYLGHVDVEKVSNSLSVCYESALLLLPVGDVEKFYKESLISVLENFLESFDLLPEVASILYNNLETEFLIDSVNAREYPVLNDCKV